MKYAVLVNTCDKFSDCWVPFFFLFKKFWPDFDSRIYLNTEYFDFNFDDLPITSVKGCIANSFPKETRPSWSLCLRWALESIPTDIILYMQEDYFLKDVVNSNVINNFVKLMTCNDDIMCIHLTDQAVIASRQSQFDNLNIVDRKQRYRVSCQASLWRKTELLELIRDSEDAWQFEEFGSKRSGLLNHLYLCVDSSLVQLNKSEIIPYIFTGIIQGKWNDKVVDLFQKNGMYVDYAKRGFVSQSENKSINRRIRHRISKIKYQIVLIPDFSKMLIRKCFYSLK